MKVFFIANNNNDSCLSYKVYSMLKPGGWFSRIRRKAVFDNYPRYSDYTNNNKMVLLVGFSKDHNSSLAISTMKNPITDDWFPPGISNAVFFMPEGDKLLMKKEWKIIFNQWVSFKLKYEFLTDNLRILLDKVPDIYERLFREVAITRTPEEAKSKIFNIYEETIADFLSVTSRSTYNIAEIKMGVLKIRVNQANLQLSK